MFAEFIVMAGVQQNKCLICNFGAFAPTYKENFFMNKKKILYVGIAVAVLILVFTFFKKTILDVVGVVLISAILSYIVLPLIKILEKRVNKTLATTLGFLILLVSITSFFVFFVPVFLQQIKDFITFVPDYIENLKLFVFKIYEKVPFLKGFLSNINISESILNKTANLFNGFAPTVFITYISTYLLVPVIMFYMIRDREKIKKFSLFLLPSKMRTPFVFTFKDINRQLRDYVFGEFIIILIVSGLMSVALLMFNYDYWLILGLIMGVFNVIPYVGPVFGSIPILLTAALGGWNRILLALVLIIVVQQIDNLIIQPRVISDSVKIHPVAVLLCVLAGGSIGSFFGMLLAIPVYIILRILFKEFYRYFSERKQKIPENIKL